MPSLQSLKDFAKVAAVCATCVGAYEGLWLVAKPDKLAYNIPTVCYGETEGVHIGDRYTKQECLDMLAKKLPRYYAEIAECIKVPTSDNEKIAYTSFAYNVGSGAFCKSNVLKKLNAGDHKGACNGLMAWNHAGGKEVHGLTVRRASERSRCLTPDDKLPETLLVEKQAPELNAGASKSQSGPKVAPRPTRTHEAPKPSVVCRGVWLWKHCS